jgi:hypothetical protein
MPPGPGGSFGYDFLAFFLLVFVQKPKTHCPEFGLTVASSLELDFDKNLADHLKRFYTE